MKIQKLAEVSKKTQSRIFIKLGKIKFLKKKKQIHKIKID